jgi:signal transduction histidine kinase
MLKDGSIGEATFWDVLRIMEEKTEELEGLADILSTAARLESANLPHQPITFDVASAVNTAIERITPRAQLEQATVDVYATDGPVWVSADPAHVIHILAILLNNALTYSSPKADVVVEVRPTSPVEIAVHDQGVGIPQEWHGRIFERFSRFAEGGVNRPAGLGLGLSISRDLAELNGGVLLLERSAPGEGSVFVLRLPPVKS